MLSSYIVCALISVAGAAVLDKRQSASATGPDYFQTTPQLNAGPTTTAQVAPFLAQTNPAPFGQEASFAANAPLETALPIANNPNKSSIFQLVGQLSSYFPNPDGFGANEYPLPPGANISQVHVLHRHGSRYPTGTSSVASFGSKLHNITANGTAKWSGELSFLNSWRYTLGAEILVARGRQELFDSGVLFYYDYGALYNTSTKILARTTSQDRMLKSAEYFMAGFFGLEWTNNATLEVILEQNYFNNSLAGYFGCNNSNIWVSTGGNNASVIWENTYLKNATARLKKLAGGYNWTVADTYNVSSLVFMPLLVLTLAQAQTLCPYETVAYGYSEWCNLFTYPEWQGFEYTIDLQFNGNNGFASPTGRATGIGYVEEIYARFSNHLYDLPPGSTQVNTTLDEMSSTFVLNQTLYFDFSHDTNIMSIITALGMRQFAQPLPTTGLPENQQLIVSHVTPFGARMVWEIIRAPHPVLATRPTGSASMSDYYNMTGGPTTYVHIRLNQRTVPLGRSYPACGNRDDGWCEMDTYMDILGGLLDQARFEFSCFGDYPSPKYGSVTDGVLPVGNSTRKREIGAGSLVQRDTGERWVL